MYLDSLTPISAEVGYGSLGVGGQLGYEPWQVTVAKRTYAHALSTHPPVRLAFDLGGRYATFRCRVALNDDVPSGRSHADFFVRADGREVAAEHYVLSGTGAREIVADISGAARLEEVRRNLESTGYPSERIHFVPGPVEETIPLTVPATIAVLRLDTDWYASTRHELRHLYPLLSEHGIMIVDDYGHWRGAKEATDEYFGEDEFRPFLHRIDYTGVLAVKPVKVLRV